VIAAILLSVSGWLLLHTSTYGNQLHSRLDYVWKDTTGSGRLVLWQDVIQRLLPQGWVYGTRLGMFRPRFAPVRSDRYAEINPDVHWETAHNIFLDRWSEQGIAGLLMLVALIVTALVNLHTALRKTEQPRERWAIAAVAGGFISACIGNLFNGETIP